MWEVLGILLSIVFILLLVGLAIVGIATVIDWQDNSEVQRIERRRQTADREIQNISRQTQSAILNEAVRRAQRRARATRMDRPDGGFNADGQFGPWND